MTRKQTIIDIITKQHPTHGLGNGWAKYTGGMTDSGNWFEDKLNEASEEELFDFLTYIVSDVMYLNSYSGAKDAKETEYNLLKEIVSQIMFGKQ